MFHIGHLNLLKRSKKNCDCLIVGVSTDEHVASYKRCLPIIPYKERKAIVQSIKYVDMVVPQENFDKMSAWKKYHFNVMFIGSDWKGSERWCEYERKFSKIGVDIIYLPYTKGISSTRLKKILLQKITCDEVLNASSDTSNKED